MLFSHCYGQQQIGYNKKCGELLAILIAMRMQQYDEGRIAR
jgi:hypothetical protein